ncbi:helix-turn-helix transcriptional regulator [Enterobacter sp. CFBP8995]|nr:helix-turn-helix transcriptional regulator [Enterobacter sp. CFBP8995]
MKSYEFKNNFFERIAKARALNSMTQAELAKLVGISQRQIAAYEAANSWPRAGTLEKLAQALGTTPEWLATGEGDGKVKARISPALVARRVPIIKIEDVITFMCCSFKGEGLTDKFHATSLPVSEMSFAIVCNDPAMAYSDPDGYGFPKGSIVVFDPMLEAEHLDFVMMVSSDGRVVFRQLFVGYDHTVLNPIDSRYPHENLKGNEQDDFNLMPAVSVETLLPAANRIK